jgi:hypothetical protein
MAGNTTLGRLGKAAAPPVTTDQILLDYNGAVVHNKASILAASNAPNGAKINIIEFEAATDTGTMPTLVIRNQAAVSIAPGGTEPVEGETNEECDDFTFTSYAGCTGRIRGKIIKTGIIIN